MAAGEAGPETEPAHTALAGAGESGRGLASGEPANGSVSGEPASGSVSGTGSGGPESLPQRPPRHRHPSEEAWERPSHEEAREAPVEHGGPRGAFDARPGSAGEHGIQRRLGSTSRADRFYDEQMLDHLNERMREFTGRQEMFFLATSDASGECDSSFRAGPPGFLRVLDERTLVFPEYRGNGVHASLGNIRENPQLGILLVDFLRARIGLHINGSAEIVEDAELRAVHPDLPEDPVPGRRAELWVRVSVQEAYIHCAKHIPHLMKAPKGSGREWGTDDYKRKGGDFFGAARDARGRTRAEWRDRPHEQGHEHDRESGPEHATPSSEVRAGPSEISAGSAADGAGPGGGAGPAGEAAAPPAAAPSAASPTGHAGHVASTGQIASTGQVASAGHVASAGQIASDGHLAASHTSAEELEEYDTLQLRPVGSDLPQPPRPRSVDHGPASEHSAPEPGAHPAPEPGVRAFPEPGARAAPEPGGVRPAGEAAPYGAAEPETVNADLLNGQMSGSPEAETEPPAAERTGDGRPDQPSDRPSDQPCDQPSDRPAGRQAAQPAAASSAVAGASGAIAARSQLAAALPSGWARSVPAPSVPPGPSSPVAVDAAVWRQQAERALAEAHRRGGAANAAAEGEAVGFQGWFG